MSAVLRSSLVTLIRQRANLESSLAAVDQFVTDAEIAGMIDDAAKYLYVDLVQRGGAGLPKESTQINIVADTTRYNLPANFFRCLSLAHLVSGRYWPMSLWQDTDLPAMLDISANGGSRPEFMRYQIVGSAGETAPSVAQMAVEFLPIPKTASQVIMRYVPSPVVVVSPSDASIECGIGFERFIIADACAKVMAKMDSDASFWLAERAQAQAMVINATTERDSNEPDRYVDFQSGLRAAANPSAYRRRFYR